MSAQLSQRGASLPHSTNAGGNYTANANNDGKPQQVVATYNFIGNLLFSLCPTHYLWYWGMSLIRGRGRQSILCLWDDTSPTEAHVTQTPPLLRLPTSWPLGSRVTGSSSQWAKISSLCSQPIYSSWMGLGGGEGILFSLYELSPLILSSLGDNFMAKIILLFVFPFQFLVDCYMVHFSSFASFA